MTKVLVVKAEPLNDQYECECNRTPWQICELNVALKEYNSDGWEWFQICDKGMIAVTPIKEYWQTVTEKAIRKKFH